MLKLSVSKRLLPLVIIPLVALSYFAYGSISQRLRAMSHASSLQAMLEAANHGAGVVHELQIERSMSVGFIASKGNQFGSELADQRLKVDAAIEDLAAFADTDQFGDVAPGIARPLRRAIDSVDRFNAIRLEIDSFTIEGDEAARLTTKINSHLIDGIAYVAAHSDIVETREMLQAYAALVEMKELAGMEEALVTSASIRGDLGAKEFERLVELVTAEARLEVGYLRHLSDAEASSYVDTMRGASIHESQAFRRSLYGFAEEKMVTPEANDDGSPPVYDVGSLEGDEVAWFTAQMDKIGALYSLEKELRREFSGSPNALKRRTCRLRASSSFSISGCSLASSFLACSSLEV
ncbi:MAG: nitrate- and nitrite sensing domain-containing protein [Nannocystaceae bacterium]